MYERFTDRARKVIQLANQEAQRFNHEYIATEHILLGLVKEGSGVAANVLKNLDIDVRKLRLEIEKIIFPGPDMVTVDKLPQTPKVKKIIEHAIEEARDLNHNYIGTEHLLLGLLREGEGVGAQILMNLGLKLSEVRQEVLQILGCDVSVEKPSSAASQKDAPLSATWEGIRFLDGEGIRFLEQQLRGEQARNRALLQQFWNVRVVLGALAGTLAGGLLFASMGAVIGLLLGGLVAALGWRILGILAGGGAGAFLGCVHLLNEWGGLAGALLGALVGFLIAEIGRTSERRRSWWK